MLREILSKPLKELTVEDLKGLIDSSEAEDLEFKGPLPWKAKDDAEPWGAGKQKLGDYTKDEITKEVVAFANAGGGTLFLGIEETGSVATGLRPLPHANDLAERISRVLDSKIDPRLPNVEVRAIETSEGKGIVAIRTPQSWLRPHKHTTYGHCFIRRNTSAEPMTMREVRDLIYFTDKGAADIDATFNSLRVRWKPMYRGSESVFKIVAQPLSPISTGPLTSDWIHKLPIGPFTILRLSGPAPGRSPIQIDSTRPMVRAWRADGKLATTGCSVRIQENGLIHYEWRAKEKPPVGGVGKVVYATWLLGTLVDSLRTISAIRALAGSSPTYALEAEISSNLNDFGIEFDRYDGSHRFESCVFPRYAVSGPESFNAICNQFYVDLRNLAGLTAPDPPFSIEGF